MKTKRTIVTIFGAVVLAIAATSFVLVNLNNAPPVAIEQTPEPSVLATEQQAPADTVRFTAEANRTVLDQLAAHAAIETKDSTYGVYVDTINGKQGGTDGKYWTFYVDGQMAQVGAAEYVTQGGEVIEWRFE